MQYLTMSSEMDKRVYRVVHAPIPKQWEGITPRPRIVADVTDTNYLSDNVSQGTEIWVGGVNLGLCVFDHLLALAKREPVIEGRVAIFLSQSSTLTYHQEDDTYGPCSREEFEQVVDMVSKMTGIKIRLAE